MYNKYILCSIRSCLSNFLIGATQKSFSPNCSTKLIGITRFFVKVFITHAVCLLSHFHTPGKYLRRYSKYFYVFVLIYINKILQIVYPFMFHSLLGTIFQHKFQLKMRLKLLYCLRHFTGSLHYYSTTSRRIHFRF